MFLFARAFGHFFLFFLIVAPCSEKVFFMESAVLLIFGMLVRHKGIICQNLVILMKLDVPCGVIFIILNLSFVLVS